MARITGFAPAVSGQQPLDSGGNPVSNGGMRRLSTGVAVFGTSGTLAPGVADIPTTVTGAGHGIDRYGVAGQSTHSASMCARVRRVTASWQPVLRQSEVWRRRWPEHRRRYGFNSYVGGTATAVRSDAQSCIAGHGICTNGQAVRGDGNAGVGLSGASSACRRCIQRSSYHGDGHQCTRGRVQAYLR